MARLLYTVITSLDGYISDENGSFDWSEPDEEVHAFIDDQERTVGTQLLGRRMYEVLRYWETALDEPGQTPAGADFARQWLDADKIVYSRTLTEVSTAHTRIEREFDPTEIARLKETAARDLVIGGPGLARHAFAAGLVDECRVFVVPMLIGGGKQAFPAGFRSGLELLDQRRFAGGTVFLRYATRP
ncbi:dihydrofolate reductase family protein [Streptomyces sp. B-S-A8]|uniref:Dihydrofolate reductase family protein n=1 Tax=Streptomyces solicavernae TaxID=3043614 RepID=A0ABT6RMK8_9ACTN|nr:dihydrofolate reductase family protein [Streptomyces sp. B-S-A8]MDI3384983.1 dihydrofolate reductase family protein [Streptomyces sp. B-S-A8]